MTLDKVTSETQQFFIWDWYFYHMCWCPWRTNVLFRLLGGSRPIFFHYIIFSSARALIIKFELSSTVDIMQLLQFRLRHFQTCLCACPCSYANSKVVCDCYSFGSELDYNLHLLWLLCCWHHRRLHFSSQGREYYLQVTVIRLGLSSIAAFTCCVYCAAEIIDVSTSVLKVGSATCQ